MSKIDTQKVEWVLDLLTNDESSDEELSDWFVSEGGMDKSFTDELVKHRTLGDMRKSKEMEEFVYDNLDKIGESMNKSQARQIIDMVNEEKDTDITKVVFRKFKDGEDIIALFPEEYEDAEHKFVVSYMHMGQHSGADYKGMIEDTTPATPAEYKELYNELVELGYNLQIINSNESLSEGHEVGATILQQLGGNKFIAMTGASNFIGIDDYTIAFKIGRNSKGVNYVKIHLNGMDTYDIEFINARMGEHKIISKVDDVYADQLQEVFTEHTGMYTSLGTMGR